MYQFIQTNEKVFPCQAQCQILQVSRSGYYAWRKGKTYQVNQSKQKMEQKIIETFSNHKRRYGARRISKSLAADGQTVSRYKAGKVLHKYGLKAIQPRSFVPKTTNSRHAYKISPNLLLKRVMPGKANEVWVGDITYIPLAGGTWCYLAVWMDLFSRRIIGWHLDDNMQEPLIVTAFKKALATRKVSDGLIVHSDRGGQYAGNMFRTLINRKNILQSMSRADNPYDNAFMESCFSRFKAELLQDGIFETIEDAHTEIFEFIEMYYNIKRIHSSLNYKTPAQFEKDYTFDVHKQTAMLYTEESLTERGIEPLSVKHKPNGSALPDVSSSYFLT
ncbi:MAG: IS3 family transposase [Saprospiraceae bacterium]